ncbi:hypothetical protein DRW07_17490 [Alteromonas sediminis]|uniref:FlgO domain-containing protein n=1 Tax=Alteromonas sediminis TaxID=2259342 RepID=A0A3N5Z4Q7_9ALTE|nr:FlgO family outer membrane protein [Alteromonas sediminis]RPJ65104.1 hypothetical protein DRW07_17490 [Alteromonas sediminis]
MRPLFTSMATFVSWFCLFVVVWGLLGCASQEDMNLQAATSSRDPVPPLGNVEYHTFQLANELFSQVQPARQTRYAVVGFVPIPTHKFDADNNHPLQLLGHQIREGMITEATKRGFTAQEFLISSDIKLTAVDDRVLSRSVDELSNVQRVDYYITGTILHQQEGAVVNARIVHVRNKEVVAAATRFFPGTLFWREEQVTTRQGRLYRMAKSDPQQ